MNRRLLPANELSSQTVKVLVPLLLLISATLVFVAPMAMPASYSFISNVISESAAQGLQGAWIARLGFLFFGLGVMVLSLSQRKAWVVGAYWCHVTFGLCMLATAAFSHKPWLVSVPYDEMEDLLHSFFATAMGFAFSFGVLIRLLQREKHERNNKLFDIVALVAATAIPLIGWYLPTVDGLVQRVLFVIAYIWYAAEALNIHNGRTVVNNND